ncbi:MULTISPECIES: group II intron maturase-specific domain-containing protein [Sinorhizobium]|uniref:group II intron maturase-specific domain-containing protein n=1 Tax=Sinorhizobium TaxID=28105 RepID=UPI001F3EA96B|nr:MULTISPECIES: group II intron maturase-specific domain-containing protein [Sinorhizobium]WOS67247.1 group II intron maturase-specific domain-containing protein [Sinorhizobium fredii GR64]
MTGRDSTSVSLGDKLREINPILRGWANYYRHCVGAGRVFVGIDWYVGLRLFCWLGKKRPKAGVRQLWGFKQPSSRRPTRRLWREGRSSNTCSAGPPSAGIVWHGWERLTLPCFLESRMRNERRMSGSAM